MQQTDWERYQLKGRVKEMLTETFAVLHKTGEIKTDYWKRKTIWFNEYGMITELRDVNPNGTVDMDYINRYDEKQRWVEHGFINPDGTYSGSYKKFNYDDKDRLIEELVCSETGGVFKEVIHTYNDEGLHAFKRYDNRGKCRSFILEWRNPETNIVENHYYNDQDKLETISWNTYPDNNGSMECITFDGCRNFKRKSVYVHDTHGNRVEYYEEITSVYDHPLHCQYKNEYDEKGNLLTHTAHKEEGVIWFRNVYQYDAAGNMIEKKVYGRLDHSPPDELYLDHVDVVTLKYY
jgi:hypothetical protein